MSELLISIAAFLVAIAILVAVHEWGHYIVARWIGIKVLRFSVGFGKPLWMKRAGPDQTEYCLSAIPLGGYVKLLDERDCEVSPAERHRSFNSQSIPARIAVLLAGPGLNFLFAIVAYWCMFVIGVPGVKPVVGEIASQSIAAQAGLMAGDQVRRVGEREVSTWEGTVLAMLDELLADGDIDLTVIDERGTEKRLKLATKGRQSELTEPGKLFSVLGMEPWSPVLEPIIETLTPGAAAEQAGMQSGDRIVGAAGRSIETWVEWVEFVRSRPGETVLVRIERDGRALELELMIGTETRDGETIGRIGAGVAIDEGLYEGMRARQQFGVAAALWRGVVKTWEMSALTVRMIGRMMLGDVSMKNISGPINIAQYAGYSASIGFVPFLNFLAIVSISLGILNLLPIPLLDGGQIVYQLVEAVKGKPLSERAQLIGQQMGIALVLLLMTFAVYNDLARIFG